MNEKFPLAYDLVNVVHVMKLKKFKITNHGDIKSVQTGKIKDVSEIKVTTIFLTWYRQFEVNFI